MQDTIENNISNIKGTLLKKWLGADKASFWYKNRNKTGGNFGMLMRFGHDSIYLHSDWNNDGELYNFFIQVNHGRAGYYTIKALEELGDLVPIILKDLQEKTA